jgi:phosphoenolpyruvate carboxylase
MSTQHPDNVSMPFFARDSVLGGEDEIREAFYAYSNLGCDEQMWDCEGKEVDNYVVKKLLTKYEDFFKKNHLGKDIFLTLRVPNPTVERQEAKILLETLESIPRSYDAAKLFYKDEISPIFEVILPMTASCNCIDRIYRYYCDFVIGKQEIPFRTGDITICEWIGEFKPKEINVIPLFEDMKNMLDSHEILKKYLEDKDISHQRVFLARSDPAMNYGIISAVLLNKISLLNMQRLSQEIGVKIYPIIGVGSAPFRGNFKPGNVIDIAKEYSSANTFTIQSAFKYDYPSFVAREAIERLKSWPVSSQEEFDVGRALKIIEKYCGRYQEQIARLAPVINKVARYIPSRRKRKLHIGLFGYSRNVGGIRLPRVITFTAALYSIGLPPEILGLSALEKDDIDFLKKIYFNFENDFSEALRYVNLKNSLIDHDIRSGLENIGMDYSLNKEHIAVSDKIISQLENSDTENIEENIIEAARLRSFLG